VACISIVGLTERSNRFRKESAEMSAENVSKDQKKGEDRTHEVTSLGSLPPPVQPYVRSFRLLLDIISKIYTPVRVLLAVVGLVVAAYYGERLRNRVLYTQKNVFSAWQAVSNASFITVTSKCCGIGNGTITYSVGSN
jgi:hypothetical protein